MKPIAGGVNHVSHMNVKATNTDPLPGMKGSKDTSMGKDIGGNATNKIGGGIHLTRAESPNAKSHSRNQ